MYICSDKSSHHTLSRLTHVHIYNMYICIHNYYGPMRCTLYISTTRIEVYVFVPRQPTCMKLGTRELYQPIQFCHVVCLGISNKSVAATYIHILNAVPATLAEVVFCRECRHFSMKCMCLHEWTFCRLQCRMTHTELHTSSW